MKRYPSYKESGVEWIGEIPIGWNLKKLKELFENRNEKNEDLCEDFLSITKDRGVIPYSEKGNVGNKTSDDIGKYKKVYPEDIVVNPMNIIIGSVGVSKYNGVLSNIYIVLKPIKILSGYGSYIFHHKSFQLHLKKICYGIMELRESLNKIEFFIEKLPLPPLSEQTQIVSYLDRKTEGIDKLIQTKERKIELLKEYRTSLISKVVTKGLNPNVKMKDSGVEWIGEIPNYYQIGKLKNLCKENQRNLSNSTDPNYELQYIEISDVNSEGIINNSTPYIFSESPSRCRRIVQKGDVIVSTVRTYLKSIGLIEEEVKDLICSTGFSVLTPNIEINPKYLFYLLRTEWFISMVISKSEGVSYPSIQSEKLMNIEVVFCKLSEQHEIVSYLDEQTQLIDKNIQTEERKIELLKEYRQSLISEVVTGKIKVSNDEEVH